MAKLTRDKKGEISYKAEMEREANHTPRYLQPIPPEAYEWDEAAKKRIEEWDRKHNKG